MPEKKAPPVAPPATPTPQAPYVGYAPYAPVEEKPPSDKLGSVYIPMDSWMYPALTRLYGMGFLDTMFLGIWPYTRRSTLHHALKSEDAILSSDVFRRSQFWRRGCRRVGLQVAPDMRLPAGLMSVRLDY